MRKTISFIAALGLLGLSTVAAHADTSVSATISGNVDGLSVTSPGSTSFSTTLNGSDQVLYASLGSFQVTDSRGTGSGWHVTFQSDQLITGAHSLPQDSLALTGITAACASNTTCTGTASGLDSRATIDAASAVDVASAAVDNGMGTYVLTPSDFTGHVGKQLSLAVPAGAYAGNYSSTITITIASLPS